MLPLNMEEGSPRQEMKVVWESEDGCQLTASKDTWPLVLQGTEFSQKP